MAQMEQAEGITFSNADGTVNVVPVDLGDGWLVAYYVDVHDGEPVIGEVRVMPAPTDWRDDLDFINTLLERRPSQRRPEHPLTARRLRSELRPGEALAGATARLKMTSDDFLDRYSLMRGADLSSPRRGTTDRFYAALSVEYVAALRRGSRRPVEHVADLVNAAVEGPHRYRTTHIRDALIRAREKGFLEPRHPGRGKAEGWITARCEQVLTEALADPRGLPDRRVQELAASLRESLERVRERTEPGDPRRREANAAGRDAVPQKGRYTRDEPARKK